MLLLLVPWPHAYKRCVRQTQLTEANWGRYQARPAACIHPAPYHCAAFEAAAHVQYAVMLVVYDAQHTTHLAMTVLACFELSLVTPQNTSSS